MFFSNIKINPTGNFLFGIGWFFVNLYTTFYLLYKKSIIASLVQQYYTCFTSNNSIEYVPNVENCDFVIYTFDHIRKKIARRGQPLLDEPHKALKESPFLSTEILVTSSDGKSITNYPIEFRTDRYDFYVEGNIFHHLFLTYFMKKYYYVNLFDCDYSIHAIDRTTFDTVVFLKNGPIIKITEKATKPYKTY